MKLDSDLSTFSGDVRKSNDWLDGLDKTMREEDGARYYEVNPDKVYTWGIGLLFFYLGISVIISKAFSDIPDETVLKQYYGYDNVCVYLDFPPVGYWTPPFFVLSALVMMIAIIAYWYLAWDLYTENKISLTRMRLVKWSSIYEIFCLCWFIICLTTPPTDLPTLGIHTYPFILYQWSLFTMQIHANWYGFNYGWPKSIRSNVTWLYVLRTHHFLMFFVTLVKSIHSINGIFNFAFYELQEGNIAFANSIDKAYFCVAILYPLLLRIYLCYFVHKEGDRMETMLVMVNRLKVDSDEKAPAATAKATEPAAADL